ncbi:MAG: hypothetical protein LBH00_06670 [Planctomycetaceae bacterium]|jgi:hypothetical protein|nr:hypothetical protein [Planctomycetaceae bacterium]
MSDARFSRYTSDLPYQEPDLVPKKSRRGCLLYGCGCGCLGLILLLLFGGLAVYFYCIKGSPLTVSPETTVITEPRKSDGKSVDYYQAIQKMTEPAIPADENGFRSVLLGYGQAATEPQKFNEWLYPEMCKKLDIDPAAQPPFVLEPWIPAAPKNWLAAVSPGLDTVQTAAAKRHYFIPLVRQNENDPVLLAEPIPVYVFHKNLSDALRQRAKLRFEANAPAEAWKDILTSIRLFRFVTIKTALFDLHGNRTPKEGGKENSSLLTPVEEIVQTFPRWKPEHLDQAVKDLESLPEWTDYRTTMKVLQFSILDGVSSADDIAGIIEKFNENPIPPEIKQLLQVIGFNWNETAKALNGEIKRYEDELQAAAGDTEKLSALLRSIRFRMNEEEWLKIIQDGAFGTPITTAGRSQMAGTLAGHIVNTLVGEMIRLQLTEESRCQILRTALAVEKYRRQNNRFPDSPEQLGLPKIGKNDLQIRYQKTNSGCSLGNDFFRLEMK